jgi:hypothetical protein
LGQFDHHTAVRKIDRGHDRVGEWQQQRRAARGCNLDDVAGAEIVDCDDAADRLVRRIDRGKPDQAM